MSAAGLSKERLRLWLRLLKASSAIEAELRRRLRDRHGTTLPRFDVMSALARSPEGLKMSEISGKALEGYYLLSGNRDLPGGFPIGQQWTMNVRNNHLQYAITWFSLALALLVIYILYHRKQH